MKKKKPKLKSKKPRSWKMWAAIWESHGTSYEIECVGEYRKDAIKNIPEEYIWCFLKDKILKIKRVTIVEGW